MYGSVPPPISTTTSETFEVEEENKDNEREKKVNKLILVVEEIAESQASLLKDLKQSKT